MNKPILLNDFEVMTLHEAYKREKEGRKDRIFLRSSYKDCKTNLPTLISKKLILVDHLKYCGVIVLSEKGIEAGKKLDDSIK